MFEAFQLQQQILSIRGSWREPGYWLRHRNPNHAKIKAAKERRLKRQEKRAKEAQHLGDCQKRKLKPDRVQRLKFKRRRT